LIGFLFVWGNAHILQERKEDSYDIK